eukprot:GHVU01123427.1.p1 GENE.GHVU01123427.1~~GHVU01123427.1.p1  ORF type:complete len:106 (-),score=15.15 GHVU01123427.1:92-409(-)
MRFDAIISDGAQPDPTDHGHWRYRTGFSCLGEEEEDDWFPGDQRFLMEGERFHEPWYWDREVASGMIVGRGGRPEWQESIKREQLHELGVHGGEEETALGYARRT